MVDLVAVHDDVWSKLDVITGVNAFDGEVPATPPVDDDGRVHAYAVLYFSPGALFASALNAVQGSLAGSFQVTCVGGDPTRALWCVEKVRTALVGASVVIDERTYIVRARSEDPGSVRRDDDVKPPRHYVPLEFQMFIP